MNPKKLIPIDTWENRYDEEFDPGQTHGYFDNGKYVRAGRHERIKDFIRKEVEKREVVFRWLLGMDGEFPPKKPSDPAYYWRKELRRRLEDIT